MAIHCCDGATAVCDDGVPLPAERRKLDSCGLALAGAAGALAHPLVAGGSLLLQTTGKRCQWPLCFNATCAACCSAARIKASEPLTTGQEVHARHELLAQVTPHQLINSFCAH